MNSADACAGGGSLGGAGVRRNRPNAASGGANAADTCSAAAAMHTPPKSAFDVLEMAAADTKPAPGGPEPDGDSADTTSACDRICSNAESTTFLPQQASTQVKKETLLDNDMTAQQQLARALAELDRERTKRAEAETRCATLSFDARRLRSDTIIFRRQRDAFVDMVESLTADSCDAVLYASSRSEDESTLSLHDIRLLEIMPWDERVRDVAEVLEEVYEWQVYDSTEGRWTNRTEIFPDNFRSLPVHKPCPAGTTTAAASSSDNSASTQQNFQGFVLTDRSCTHILDLEGGYPLPSAGSTWRWIGGWRVELQHPCGTPCDEGGWTYCNLPQLLVSNAPGAVFGSPSPPSLTDVGHATGSVCPASSNDASAPPSSPPKLQFRRRRWTRLRVLLSYPSISARTEACLYLLAENAILDLKAAKMEDCAHQMMDMAREKDEMNRRLRRRLRSTEAALRALEQEKVDAGIDDAVVGSNDSMKKIADHTPSMSSSPSPTPSSPQNTKRRWSLSFPLTLSSASSPKPIYADSNPNNPAHGIPPAPVLEDDDPNEHRDSASSSSQDTTYSTDPNSSEDDADFGTEGGTSIHPISAKSIAEKACHKSVDQGASTAVNPQWANHHAVHGVINGARRSIDEGGAFLGRMLRPKVPTELRGNLGKIQLDDKDAMCASRSNCEEGGGEPFRIPGGGSPTVSY